VRFRYLIESTCTGVLTLNDRSYARDIGARNAEPVPSLDNTEKLKREADPMYASYHEYIPPSLPAK
jgi:hypothetical protein